MKLVMKSNSLIYFAAALMLGCFSLGADAQVQTPECNKTVYLTFDTGNMSYKVGAQDGERYVQYEQRNVEAIREECKNLREFYKEHGTDNPFFAGTAHMMNLPKCFAHEISSKWFDNRPWELIKRDKEDKIKFYAIVNQYYSDFVCHPSGKIPIPYNPLIATK